MVDREENLDTMHDNEHMLHRPLHEHPEAPHVHGPDCAHGPAAPYVRDTPKVGRNEPCSCGSGKKFKKCCGA